MSLWMHMQFNKKLNLKLNPNKSILVVDLSIEIRNPDLESLRAPLGYLRSPFFIFLFDAKRMLSGCLEDA